MLAAPVLLGAFANSLWAAGEDWPLYGGEGGRRFSSLTQITPANVANLLQAWRFDMAEPGDPQTHPLAIDGVVYAYTPSLETIALDGASGKLLWRFQSGVKAGGPQRGLTYWGRGKERRLFANAGSYLYALDPATGKPIAGFGQDGRIDLRAGLGRDPDKISVALTAPGTIWRDMIIMGFRTAESAPAAPGDIRAFDVRTGKLRWAFHTIPHPGEPGHESWPADYWKTGGGANNWAGMVLDEKRGMVFAPTGSAVSDFYGADRIGDNLYANSLLALDANTGKLIWHFQGVRHDIADRDFPSPPVLLTMQARRQAGGCGRPAEQAGLSVRAGPCDRQAAVSDFGNGRAAQHCAGRETACHPAGAIPARALCPPASERGAADQPHARGPSWALEQFRTFAQ